MLSPPGVHAMSPISAKAANQPPMGQTPHFPRKLLAFPTMASKCCSGGS